MSFPGMAVELSVPLEYKILQMEYTDPPPVEFKSLAYDPALHVRVGFCFRGDQIDRVQDDFHIFRTDIVEEAFHHFRIIEGMVKDAFHSDGHADLLRCPHDPAEALKHGLIALFRPGGGGDGEVAAEASRLGADHVSPDPFCISKMIDKTQNGVLPCLRVGICRIDIAAEYGDMKMPCGKLFSQIPAQARAVMSGGKIVIAEGFARRKLDVLDSQRLKAVENLCERSFRTDVMSTHSKLNHLHTPFF